MFGRLIWDSDSSGMMTLADGKTAEFALDFDDADEAGAEAARNILKFLLENEPLIRHKIAVCQGILRGFHSQDLI